MEFSEITRKYWAPEDWDDLSKCGNPTDLLRVALKILKKMPQEELSQVCGPITTGGFGNIVDNLNAFNETIKKLHKEGKNVFDQMPFEDPMQSLKEKPGGNYNNILTDFYHPIFKSGHIKKLYFMPGWEQSNGARWEHEVAKDLGIQVEYL